MHDRLALVRLLNPEFAEAERRGEKWATEHADMVRGVDGRGSRRHPERAPKEDGKPHNWCGDCLHPEGCITCDLDAMPPGRRKEIGSYQTHRADGRFDSHGNYHPPEPDPYDF